MIRRFAVHLAAALFLAGCALAQSLSPASADREALRARIDAQPTDYDSSFAYVRLSIEARDYEAAIGVLERMLTFNPALSRAHYELGSLYFRLASYAKAARHYQAAATDPGLDPDLRARAAAYLPIAAKELQTDRWYGLLMTGLRYNSNPGSEPSGSTLSALGLLATGNGAKPAASAFALGDLRYVHEFGNERGDTFEARAQGYAAKNFRNDDFDAGLADIVLGPKFRLPVGAASAIIVSPYVAASAAATGGGYRASTAGGGLSVRFPLSAFAYLEPGVEARAVNVRDPAGFAAQGALNSGSLWSASLAARVTPMDGVTIDARGHYARNSTSTSFLSSRQWGLQGSVKFDFESPFAALPLNWSFTPYARVVWTSFDAPNPFLFPGLVARRDMLTRLGAQLDMPVSASFGFTANVEHRNNHSNVALVRSSGWSGSLAATARF